MRPSRGFTLVELMIVVAIAAVVAALMVFQGRSARQSATFAQSAYDLALRISGLKARAMSGGRELVLIVVDTADPAACKERESACGRVLLLRSPDYATFALTGLDPDAAVTGAEFDVDERGARNLARNSQLDLGSTWRAPAPFASVTAFDPNVMFACAGGRRCFGIRFRPDGEVRPILAAGAAVPGGFAFVIRPYQAASAAAERRAVFISFPAGIVKTAAF